MYYRPLLLTGVTVFVLGGIALAFYLAKTSSSQKPRPSPRRSDEDDDDDDEKIDADEFSRRKIESAQRAALKAAQGPSHSY